MEYVKFAGEQIHITEAVSILQCSGMNDNAVFLWLERKLCVGRFALK